MPADLVLVHVDLSVVPESYLEFAARYPIVLNGRVRDIRKTVTSRYLVQPGDGWDGPVIVKSDLNCGGAAEYGSSQTGLRRVRVVRAVARRRTAIPTWRDYRIFARLADVPVSLVENPDLVVERFLPDIEDGLYHVHMYQFLGDGERCSRIGSRGRSSRQTRVQQPTSSSHTPRPARGAKSSASTTARSITPCTRAR